MSMKLNNRLHKCAQILNDGKLLARFGSVQEFKYNFACLTDLYNKERMYLRATKRLEQKRGLDLLGY